MKYGIISDIHANFAALEAVLADIKKRGGVDQFRNLGDVVGYGPDPLECIEMLREIKAVSIAGNHDWAACGRLNTDKFNPDAAEAVRWTASQLTRVERRFLDDLPKTLREVDFSLAHGSPRDPIWEYLVTARLAKENFEWFEGRVCLVGHSHMPLFYSLDENGQEAGGRFHNPIDLSADKKRYIINPGAVGQPRDGNPQAAYAIYDSEQGTVTPYRVDYDIESTQRNMKRLRLPIGLSVRLSNGV